MYAIAGATGRVGSSAAEQLLAAGVALRVIVRTRTDAERWRLRGADARIADLSDRGALADALAGTAGFFTLLPFDLQAEDLDAYADDIIAATAGAVADSGVPHVVMLSSGGADLPSHTGPISSLHRLEKALRGTGSMVSALRSGHFQEKVGDVLEPVRAHGVYPVFAASADVPLPMAATMDLGKVAAHVLQNPPLASEVIDVLGPAYTERQVAKILGAALGREVEVDLVPEAAWHGALTEAGYSSQVAASLVELYQADEAGRLMPRGDRLVNVDTPLESTLSSLI